MWTPVRRMPGGRLSFPPGATPPTVQFDEPVTFTCPSCGETFIDDHRCTRSDVAADPPPGSSPTGQRHD